METCPFRNTFHCLLQYISVPGESGVPDREALRIAESSLHGGIELKDSRDVTENGPSTARPAGTDSLCYQK